MRQLQSTALVGGHRGAINRPEGCRESPRHGIAGAADLASLQQGGVGDLVVVTHSHRQREGLAGVVHLLQLPLDRATSPEDAEGIAKREDPIGGLPLQGGLEDGFPTALLLVSKCGQFGLQLLDALGLE